MVAGEARVDGSMIDFLLGLLHEVCAARSSRAGITANTMSL
jgi:hypothetical protein